MPPRTAKAKKAAEPVEVSKKVRGKGKNVEELEADVIDADVDEKVSVTDKKPKRGGKKVASEANGDQNGKVEDAAPPVKRGKKKNAAPEEKDDVESNEDHSAEEEAVAVEHDTETVDSTDTNGHSEESESVSSGKGRKKPAKKPAAKKEGSDVKPTRGRKGKQEVESELPNETDKKPKATGRGRKAATKPEDEPDEEKVEAKPDVPASKGRKKGPSKATKEKSPEVENEDEAAEEPKKKETRGKKIQTKKTHSKEDIKEKEEEAIEEEPLPKKRKVNKKEEKGKGESKDGEVEEEAPEAKSTKGRRGQKKAPEPGDEPQDTGEANNKRKRKGADEKAPEDSKKKAPPKNKATTDYESLDFSNSSKSTVGKDWNFKISSWNVDGIRAWMNKGGLDFLKHEKPDILCVQETKCSQDKLPDEVANVPGYHAYWLGSQKEGYAGVGIYTTKLAMNVQYGLQNEGLDDEGRIITAEYEQFYLICTYVPNAGRKLVTLPKRLEWNEEFRKHVKELDKKKPVIICGDMNVSHNEIDLANPKTNRKNAGFTDEERAGLTELLGEGLVDTFRRLRPDAAGAYTFWTYMMNARAKNVGWRLDYFLVSERLLPSLCDNVIRDKVFGSDHCPISLFLHLTSADKPKE